MKLTGGVVIVLVCIVLSGCESKDGSIPRESPSEGSLTIYCDDAVMPLMQSEVAAYDSIYPHVRLTLVGASARDVVVKLLSGETKLIVLGRKFAEDEKALITKYNIPYGEYEIARDALAVIVNRANPGDTLSIDNAKRTLIGGIRNWSVVYPGFSSSVRTIVPSASTSAYGHMVEGILGGNLQTADEVVDSSANVVARVRANRGAIGIVDWNRVWNDTTVKVLKLAGTDSTGSRSAYTMLHPATIHTKRYPLRHSIYGYTTEGRPALAKGFLAFVCNADGQRIALGQGLVPATQIIRLREPE